MALPKVSVIVPVYNCEMYVGRCIRSLMAQTFSKDDYEVIVINDASVDKTQYALDLFGDEITVINHQENRGLPAALNSGIAAAKGQYIIRLDADDYVHAEYLNVLSLFLGMNHACDAVACDYFEVNDREEIIRRVNCKEEPIGCGIMFRLTQLIDIGLYDEEIHLHEDKDLRYRFEEKYEVQRVPLPLYRYRQHKNNITNNKENVDLYYEKLNKKHLFDFREKGKKQWDK